jgi:hypothetical protein
MLLSNKKHYASARLLDRVTYVSRKPEDVTDLLGNSIVVADTMAYNSESKTAPSTALRWAEGYHFNRQTAFTPEPIEVVNREFSITIIDIDVRAEGGRAYKIIDDKNRRFDLREDQILEIIAACGINKGGRVPGQFMWGILGSQVKLVLVGGQLYNEMKERAEELKVQAERKATGLSPNNSKLQVGHVYEKRDKSIHAFVGRVTAPGNDKTLYALLELPQKPEKREIEPGVDFDQSWIEIINKINDISDAWDTMSWMQRCEWDWADQYWYTKVPQFRGANVVLMASPKFEFEVSADASDLVKEVRDNVECRHVYVNGSGQDLAEIYSLGPNPRRDWHEPRENAWYYLTRDQQDQREKDFGKKVQTDIIAARAKFRDSLTWKV